MYFPNLLAMYNHLDSLVAKPGGPETERDHAARAQRLVVKIFWSCTHFILPPCLAEGDAIDGWMNAFFITMRRPCTPAAVDEPEELNEVPEWKTKKWIGQVLTRFLKRYGSPKKVPVDEPWAHTIVENFKSRHAEPATAVMLHLLSSEPNGQQLSRRVAHLALDFIEEAIETAQLWAIILPHVDTLLTRVVFSYLCFSEADEDLWANDPGEYVRKQYDFTEDLTSPRMAASNLLSKMADLRSKKTILPFLQYLMQSVLEPFQRAPAGSPERARLTRQKVGAFASLAAVKVKLISRPDLANSLMSVLKIHVEPDLQSEFGILRSESAWLLGQISSCGWEEFSKQIGESALRGCVLLLADADVPVQASAAGALQFLMDQNGASTLIEPAAPHLLERLLQLMDRMPDGFASLLPAVDKLVERYSDKIMPVAVPLVQRLISAFLQSSGGILTEGDDDDDDLVFTAAQVLHLVSSVLSSVGEWTQVRNEERSRMFATLEKELEPLLSPMFEETHQVFVEELLDILGILIVQVGELNGRLSPLLLSLVPKMAAGFEDWAADYVEQMKDSIEGYLTFGLGDISAMDGGTGLNWIIGMVERLWSDKFEDCEAVYGAKISECLVMNLAKVETVGDATRRDIVVRIGRGAAARIERLIRCRDDGGSLRERLFCVVCECCYVDAEGVLKGLGSQSLMQMIGRETQDLGRLERIYTKKSVILGLCGILCTRGFVQEESKPHLVRLMVELQKLVDVQRAGGVSCADVALEGAKTGGRWGLSGKELNGLSGFSLPRKEDAASDLEDDEDATNLLEEWGERQSVGLGSMSGLGIGQVQQLVVGGGGVLESGLFDFDDVGGHEDDDELVGVVGHVLDEIDEVAHLVRCVKVASVDVWWECVGKAERDALEVFAKRVDGRARNRQSPANGAGPYSERGGRGARGGRGSIG